MDRIYKMIDLKQQLVAISKYAGARFDLAQAGGGNSSIKSIDGLMYIKSSGCGLCEVAVDKNIATVDLQKVKSILSNSALLLTRDKRAREIITSNLMKDATLDENRPSIETLLHSLMYKHTLHTHPIVVGLVVSQKNWIQILETIFAENEYVAVCYETPGIELALRLDQEIKTYGKIPKITFLQNHGLIISSNDYAEISFLTEMVIEKIETYYNLDMAIYKTTNQIIDLLNKIKLTDNIAYVSDDVVINDFLSKISIPVPFCPDVFVYCGFKIVFLKNINDLESLETYLQEFHELPKVLILNNRMYFIALSIKKAKEMEEVMKFHLIIQNQSQNLTLLPLEELAYLNNWEAEKYRQHK